MRLEGYSRGGVEVSGCVDGAGRYAVMLRGSRERGSQLPGVLPDVLE